MSLFANMIFAMRFEITIMRNLSFTLDCLKIRFAFADLYICILFLTVHVFVWCAVKSNKQKEIGQVSLGP